MMNAVPPSTSSLSSRNPDGQTDCANQSDCVSPQCATPEQLDEAQQSSATERSGNPALPSWSRGKRLTVSLLIFIMLLGALIFVSRATTVPWRNEPTGQTMATLAADTSVTFDDPEHVMTDVGAYDVTSRYITIKAVRPSTGEVQRIRVLIREPVNPVGKVPGVVFMHGAGYGTCDNSFGDVAESMASAGMVTAVLDKPVWSTNDLTRDYPGSAVIYDQVVRYVRGLDMVDATKVGIYATSESTWISAYLLRDDPDIAFQVLLSPMVYSPRHALGFLAAQDFALVGANEGYQSIVRRVFHVDSDMLGLHNFDIDTLWPQAYAVPTLVAYGSKDVMTAQVQGAQRILALARQAGNTDVTIRSYAVANHVLRLGDESQSGTPFADAYIHDTVDWVVGTTHGLQQTSERVAGSAIYQSIAVPMDLRPSRSLTVYGLCLHISTAVLTVLTIVVALVALGRKIRRAATRRGAALGFTHGFGNALATLTIVTVATLALFAAGLGQVIMGVVNLSWGGAPTDDPGMMYWSWPVIQVVCTLVVWAWSRVLARLLEVACRRGIIQWPPRKGAIREVVSGEQPVLASTRLGRVLFWMTAITMLHVLLVFAFWGMFVY